MNSIRYNYTSIFKFILLFSLIIGGLFASAQEKYSITGKVIIEHGTIENTIISLFKNAEKQGSKVVESTGKFSYELDFGNDYIFEFSKEGFVTKKVSISTFVPDEVLSRDSQFPPFKFKISLFPAYKGLDLSIFDQPMGIIMYDKELDDFDYDRDYDSQIRDAIRKAEEEARKRAEELQAQRLAREKAYKEAIQKGDINFRAKKYEESKLAYNEGLVIKPDEEYPKSQIAKIDELLIGMQAELEEAARLAAEQKAIDEKYAAIIALADSQFEAGDYNTSKTSYTDALSIKEGEPYPKKQITKIDKLLADQQKQAEEEARLAAEQKALNEKYDALIAQADAQFGVADYNASKSNYADALKLKVNEVYPKSQIEKIDALLAEQQKQAEEAASLVAEQKAIDQRYNALIAEADVQFGAADYSDSKSNYAGALELKANEVYPKTQIEKINVLLAEQEKQAEEAARIAAEQKALNEKYAALIAKADAQFELSDFDASKLNYTDALKLKANEVYPKTQIEKIDVLLAQQQKQAEETARLAAEQKVLDQKYDALISKADSQFEAADYSTSKLSYTDALKLKSNEVYPKTQIEKIDDLLLQLELEAKEKAKLLAQQQKQAEEAARLAAEQKVLDQKYDALISKADSQFEAADYSTSKLSYADALKLKSNEVYPKTQIEKIDDLLLQLELEAKEKAKLLAQQKLNDAKYNSLIQTADKYFNNERWQSAAKDYKEALQLKSEEVYPKNKLEEINIILAEIERKNKEKETLKYKYAEFIKEADERLENKEYSLSVLKYQEALKLKPKESYPKNQIKRIEVLMEREALAEKKKKELNQKYDKEIELADGFFSEEKYSVSRYHYKAALKIKQEAEYPKEQLAEIVDRLKALKLSEQVAIEDNPTNFENKLSIKREREYANFIEKGDESIKKSEYTVAKVMFERALNLFDREYPKNKVKEIEKLIREGKDSVLTKEYRRLIALADKELVDKQYSVARFYYKKAIQLNSSEKYPKSQLLKIDELVNYQKNQKIDNEYKEQIHKADNAFNKGSLTIAKFYYKKALSLKPNETYPKEKLKMIRSKQSKK
ncbi:hypothetical protein ACT3CE_00840 [Marinifilum sp. RC60d5]|uniref:hypothetical protein n=1 Tax=Marinifilum sp. RC60d5 TaxID=3458414 RepID=UPI0040352277